MIEFVDLPEVNSERWLLLSDLEGEVWKDIAGYENKYQVSCYGRVKALRQEHPHLGKVRITKEKICKPQLDKATGYYKHVFYINGNKTPKSVHRLVALSFLKNPQNLGYINHKDENKLNNHVSNLEWCTNKYNLDYSHVHERNKENYRQVLQINKDGDVVSTFDSIGDAAKHACVNVSSIHRCCVGEIGSVNRSIWRYADEAHIHSKNPRHRRVIQMSMNGVVVGMFNSIKEAADATDTSETGISRCCQGKYSQSNGYVWEYKDNYNTSAI